MKLEEKNQIEHYLLMAVERSNEFYKQDNIVLSEYWKGQVYGVIKVVNVLQLNIDTNYWLTKLP